MRVIDLMTELAKYDLSSEVDVTMVDNATAHLVVWRADRSKPTSRIAMVRPAFWGYQR
jgi:hypothetical protein